jgi:peptidoglycan/LPS O-acetylase OafA/YrhL
MTSKSSQFSERKFDALESWRGIACILVLVYHCGFNLRNPPFALFGFVGVHMFFVLSGYLLFRPYAAAMLAGRSLPDTRNFYLRRMIRIVPPYIISLLCFVLLREISGTKPPSAWNITAHAMLIFNYFPSLDFFSINGVYWSLAIEIQFYLMLPVVCLIAARAFQSRKTSSTAPVITCVLAMLIIGLVSRWTELRFLRHYYESFQDQNQDHVLFRSLFSYLDLFAFGMAAALWQLSDSRIFSPGFLQNRYFRIMLILLGIAGFFAANDWVTIAGGWQSPPTVHFGVLFDPLLCGSLALLLLCIVTAKNGGPAWLQLKPLRYIGEISYSLYLYHAGVEFFIFKFHLFHTWSWNYMTAANAAVCLLPSLAVAAVMYYLVEKPSLNLVAKIRDSKRKSVSSELSVTDTATQATAETRTTQAISLLAP